MTVKYLSRPQIAAYLGVSLTTVKQYKTFPPPDVLVGRNQGWKQTTIDAWMTKRNKPPHPRKGQGKAPQSSSANSLA
jgi:predicted DNA-binding transcriptional regulator AlpA